jgi:hypothetical protein
VVLLLAICDDGRANAITAIDLKVVDEMKGVAPIRTRGYPIYSGSPRTACAEVQSREPTCTL